MERINIVHGDEENPLIDWKTLLDKLNERSDFVAVSARKLYMKKVPEERQVVMPWLKSGVVYLCTLEGAESIVEMTRQIIRGIRDGKEERS